MSDDVRGQPPAAGQPEPTADSGTQTDAPAKTGRGADADTPGAGLTGREPGGRSPFHGLGRAILDSIVHGSPTVTTTLAFIAALVIGALVIAFSTPTVLHYWNGFFAAPGTAISATWDSIAAAVNGTGTVGAIFYPLSQTAAQATPLILTGLSVALAFRAGLFNIGAASQWIGGAIVVTWLGFAVSLPPVIHVIVCLAGGFAGGAVMGWLVGELKARTGAHEVIVTIMLNYVMYNLLAYLLGTPKALQLPHQADLISPGIAANAQLPHVGGPPPQVGVGFLIALAAAAAMWWLLARSTTGFEFRTVGANPSAARTAGMSVEKTWVLAMLLAGGLAGLSGAVTTQGVFYSLNTQSYGSYGINGITVALLGRAKPMGTVLAALLFGALEAGGTVMEASTTVPIDIVELLQGLIVLFVAAPLLIRAMFRLRSTTGTGMEAVAKGWNG